ncbi:MAG: hypothetical protein OFPI_28960 [Osedax symbiont Rs2]|nr:MAG: hypothetical protein OFPI_28960 [Osedax symbiont Rs2]
MDFFTAQFRPADAASFMLNSNTAHSHIRTAACYATPAVG